MLVNASEFVCDNENSSKKKSSKADSKEEDIAVSIKKLEDRIKWLEARASYFGENEETEYKEDVILKSLENLYARLRILEDKKNKNDKEKSAVML